MKSIRVNNCHDCPLCNNDNEYGLSCNAPTNLTVEQTAEMDFIMPDYEDKETVPNWCPLLTGGVIIISLKPRT